MATIKQKLSLVALVFLCSWMSPAHSASQSAGPPDTRTINIVVPKPCVLGDKNHGKPGCVARAESDVILTMRVPRSFGADKRIAPDDLFGEIAILESEVRTVGEKEFLTLSKAGSMWGGESLARGGHYYGLLRVDWRPQTSLFRRGHSQAHYMMAQRTFDSGYVEATSYLPGFRLYDLKDCLGVVGQLGRPNEGTRVKPVDWKCDNRIQYLLPTAKLDAYVTCVAPRLFQGRYGEATHCDIHGGFEFADIRASTVQFSILLSANRSMLAGNGWIEALDLATQWLKRSRLECRIGQAKC